MNFILMSASFALAMNNTSFARLSLILSMLLIVSIPSLIKDVSKELNSGKSTLFLSKYDSASFYLVVAASFGYIARLTINNIGTTLPYVIFFS